MLDIIPSHFFTFFCSLSLLVFNHNYVAAASTNQTDIQALLAVRSKISDPLGQLTSWNGSNHFCRWRGVSCNSRQHQRVVSIDLSSLSLSGQLSPHLTNLTFLENINLANNTFRGTIPQEMGRLRRLQVLDLRNNSFEGEVPGNLSGCQNLTTVVLINNQLGGRLPSELSSLSKLEALGLTGNNLVGKIPPSFGNLSALSVLALKKNYIEGNIPVELGHLSNLQFLQLSVNQLSGSIPEQLFNISSIQFFGLAVNHFHGQLPSNLGLTLLNLQNLYLGGNRLSGVIPPSLLNCSELFEVSMEGNAFMGPIPVNFGRQQNLQLLDLGTNQLEAPSSSSLDLLITSLTNCTNLLALSLYHNNLIGTLPKSIGNLSSSLTMLYLSENRITGGIPEEIGNLAGLQRLSLEENMLSGHIPESIGKLHKLQELHLFVNTISGEIPTSIGNITYLRRLHLANNLLQGSIPTSLGLCNHLEALDLEDNQLNGEIPKQILQLSSLNMVLSFARNNLTGTMPSELRKLTNINNLDISDNKISGRIPSSLESCQVLEILNISGNLFHGEIPSSFRTMRGLRILDASRNNLSGQIPDFLGDLTLASFNISYNNFEGRVPTGGVFKNASAISIIGNPNLCGGIKELKLPGCPKEVSKHRRQISHGVIIAVSSALSIIFIVACIFLINYRMRKSVKKPSSLTLFEKMHPRVSYEVLYDSTSGFSSTNVIGKGRYGTVYRGTLPDNNRPVAVKVFDLQEPGANKTFKAECDALKSLRHRNLVKVITSCSSIDSKGNDFKALVFEYMPKGSLQSWLHPSLYEPQPQNPAGKLNIIQRLDIATDVASALLYLHTQCDTTIIHCDLKPSNVLLDDDLRVCVSDFGLTKSLSTVKRNSSDAHSSSIGIRGTVGYLAPEYGIGDMVSTSGDMYSFGILLMELFTGKNPTDDALKGNMSLHDHVKMAVSQGAAKIVDPMLLLEEESTQYRQQERVVEALLSVLQIGLACSVYSPKDRMEIQQASGELQKIRNMVLSCVLEGSEESVERTWSSK